jgi:ParB family transcriptional regulator, chromosome partitioning protein
MAEHRGLGRGLDALLKNYPAESFGESPGEKPDIQTLPLAAIHPNPSQPRKDFSNESLQDLSASILSQGVLQPLIVRPRRGTSEEVYEIVAGERRWRAAQLAGLDSVPAFVRDLSDQESLLIALVENMQREDLNPMEEARGMDHLKESFDLTQENLAEKLGKSRPAVANALRLLQLPEHIQADIQTGLISAGHGRCLLALSDASVQEDLFGRIRTQGLSVRESEDQVNFFKANGTLPDFAPPAALPHKNKARATKAADPALREMQQDLSRILELPVTIQGSREKGKLVVSFSSSDQFQHLLHLLGMSE